MTSIKCIITDIFNTLEEMMEYKKILEQQSNVITKYGLDLKIIGYGKNEDGYYVTKSIS